MSALRRLLGKSFLESSTTQALKSTTLASASQSIYIVPKTRKMSSSHNSRVSPDDTNSAFFVCDIQDTFRPHMKNFPRLLAVSKFMLQSGLTLGVPVVITEQQPFKPTAQELLDVFSDLKVPISTSSPAEYDDHNKQHEFKQPNALESSSESISKVYRYSKTKFSMVTPEVDAVLKHHSDVKHVFLFGIEGHVCVKQTCLELLNNGYDVHLVVDAILSQRDTDLQPALQAMTLLGAKPTTAESAIYTIMKDAKHPKFKSVLPFVKQHVKSISDL